MTVKGKPMKDDGGGNLLSLWASRARHAEAERDHLRSENAKLAESRAELLEAAERLIRHYRRSVDVGPPFDGDVRREIGKWQLLKMAVLKAKGETA